MRQCVREHSSDSHLRLTVRNGRESGRPYRPLWSLSTPVEIPMPVWKARALWRTGGIDHTCFDRKLALVRLSLLARGVEDRVEFTCRYIVRGRIEARTVSVRSEAIWSNNLSEVGLRPSLVGECPRHCCDRRVMRPVKEIQPQSTHPEGTKHGKSTSITHGVNA